jgi:hypothetical protein
MIMADPNFIDVNRFGSGGQGTSFMTFLIDVPLTGTVSLGVAWNNDQWTVFGGGGVNLAGLESYSKRVARNSYAKNRRVQ